MKQRIHRTFSHDGTEISARVVGRGPSLVLVHGALDDGELDWSGTASVLADHFTCYLVSTRGRGPSADARDHSIDALVEDVSAMTDSLAHPVGVAGLSSGGMLSLAATARSQAVEAVAAYEPIAFEAMDDETSSRFQTIVEGMARAVEEGRPKDAARRFFQFISNDEELDQLTENDAFEGAARHVPVDLLEFEEAGRIEDPGPTHPSVLRRIGVPALLVHGSATALPWFTASVGHVASHLRQAEVRQLPGAGHLGPITDPEQVAEWLLHFFEPRLREA